MPRAHPGDLDVTISCGRPGSSCTRLRRALCRWLCCGCCMPDADDAPGLRDCDVQLNARLPRERGDGGGGSWHRRRHHHHYHDRDSDFGDPSDPSDSDSGYSALYRLPGTGTSHRHGRREHASRYDGRSSGTDQVSSPPPAYTEPPHRDRGRSRTSSPSRHPRSRIVDMSPHIRAAAMRSPARSRFSAPRSEIGGPTGRSRLSSVPATLSMDRHSGAGARSVTSPSRSRTGTAPAGSHNAFESLLRAIDDGATRRSGSASATMSGRARSTGSGTARRAASPPPPPMPSISRLPMAGSQSRERSKAASTIGSKISKGHGKLPSMAGSHSRSRSRATSPTEVPRVSGINKEQGKQPSMAGSQSRSRSKAASTTAIPQVSKISKGKGKQAFPSPSTRARTPSQSRAPSTKTWAPGPSTIRNLPTIPPRSRSHTGSGSVAGTLAPWDTLTHRGVGAEEWRAEAEILSDVRRSYTEGNSRGKGEGKGKGRATATAAGSSRAPMTTATRTTATGSGGVNSRFGMPWFGSGGSKVGGASRMGGGGAGSRVSKSRVSIAMGKLPDIDDLASEAQAAVRREADERQERLGGRIERMMGR
ncbi:hypothetical protein LTR53_003359 [Teratosphaeriaceae sp. CCFEE 6253]|nr:hypothetical protein LTR53_003359 [Teratosphaeriaceae sp. CCFEE 6253]